MQPHAPKTRMAALLVVLAALAGVAPLGLVAGQSNQTCVCGPFNYTNPVIPPGPPQPLEKGIDRPGYDMDPCGPPGCQFPGPFSQLSGRSAPK